MAPRASRRKAVPAAPAAEPQTSAARKAPASKRKAVPEPEPEIKATKKRTIKQATVLEPVTHATHGKVRGRGRAGKRFRDRRGACDAGGFAWPCHYVLDRCDPLAARPSHPQVPAQLFVFGDGDCGQLGLGEDVTERLRPFPVDVDGKKVGS